MKRIDTLPRLPRRADDVNKVTAGRVLVVGGSRDMAGAPSLAALGALRAGAGLVLVAVPASVQSTVAGFQAETLTTGLPESKQGGLGSAAIDTVRTRAEGYDPIQVRTQADRPSPTQNVVRSLATQLTGPLVLDADGLFAFGGVLEQLKERAGPTVLTPHEGEAARLLGITSSQVREDRGAAAQRIAEQAGAVVALKGPNTLVTDGTRLYLNASGGPSLATGGTGDVLAGILGALSAQLDANGLPPFETTCAGVYVHGAAGDLLSQTVDRGLLASDVAHAVPQAMASIVVSAP